MSAASRFGTSWLRAGSSFVVLIALLFCWVSPLAAQHLEIAVTAPEGLPKKLHILVYRDGAQPKSIDASDLSKNGCKFEVSCKESFYAELCAKGLPRPLPLFLEGNEESVTITLNSTSPEASAVRGSQMNSLYRYALEQAREDSEALHSLIEEQPEATYNAALILDRLPQLNVETAQKLTEMLQGRAKLIYHYPLLQQQLSSKAATQEGARMPDFVFVDSTGKMQHSDSLLRDSCATLMLIGATWCEQCGRAQKQLQQYCQQKKNTQLIAIEIDRHPKGWDAPYLQQLAIDHIPYLIQLDAQGNIMARDLRVWQFKLKEE